MTGENLFISFLSSHKHFRTNFSNPGNGEIDFISCPGNLFPIKQSIAELNGEENNV